MFELRKPVTPRRKAECERGRPLESSLSRFPHFEQSRFGFSLDAQQERLEAYCRMAGLEVVDLIREEGASASIPLAKRPAGARLLEWVNDGIGHLVCLKLDRLFRDAEDALRQTKACAFGDSHQASDLELMRCAEEGPGSAALTSFLSKIARARVDNNFARILPCAEAEAPSPAPGRIRHSGPHRVKATEYQ